MYDWHARRGSITKGPYNARQLREAAQKGELLSSDSVGVCLTNRYGDLEKWVLAGKVRGLFGDQLRPDSSILIAIVSEAGKPLSWPDMIADATFPLRATVEFDDRLIGSFFAKDGFQASLSTYPGNHSFTYKVSRSSTGGNPVFDKQEIVLAPEDYTLQLWYFRHTSGLQDSHYWRLYPDVPTELHEAWFASVADFQCPHCNTPWAGIYVKSILISRDLVPWQTTTLDSHVMQNPNYQPGEFETQFKNPRFLHGSTEREVQRFATRETVRDYYRCDACEGKWKVDRERELSNEN